MINIYIFSLKSFFENLTNKILCHSQNVWLRMYDTEGSEHHIHILHSLFDYRQPHQHIYLKWKETSIIVCYQAFIKLIYTSSWNLSILIQVYFKSIMSIIPVFIYKYFNFAVKATTNAGHTTNIDHSTSYIQGIF